MPHTPRLALATAPHLPDLTPDDRILQAALRARGAAAEATVWDAPRDWRAWDAVVIRSCWDSHLRRDAFVTWAESVAGQGVALANPAPMIRWNTDKRYLRDLERRGIPIVPTAWVDPPAAGDAVPALAELLATHGWTHAVVKPAISAGGFETWRVSGADAAREQARFAALADRGHGSVLVQPFVEEIVSDGEWSLVFVAGHFSHAVVKRPAPGDFRVQGEYGGSTVRTAPPEPLVHDAARVVAAAARATGLAPEALLYARVDGVARDGHFALMELECVEPSLFLDLAPDGAARMADAVLALVPRREGASLSPRAAAR